MEDFLDGDNEVTNRKSPIKKVSFYILFVYPLVWLLTLLKLWQIDSTLDSPLLPSYLTYVIGSPYIIFALVQAVGFIPGVVLYWAKQYWLSLSMFILFSVIARVMMSVIDSSEMFF